LSAGMLILSMFLHLQKSRATLAGLINLGYSPRHLAGYYFRLILAVNIIVLAISGTATALASSAWHTRLADLGTSGAAIWPTITAMAATMAILTLMSGGITWRVIREIWQK
ncbi:MAG: hypothetical protein K2I61_01395, partial [Muribaculaceae bacterium]|nr:hypothetical protein [Muribaculaceae bacterium]